MAFVSSTWLGNRERKLEWWRPASLAPANATDDRSDEPVGSRLPFWGLMAFTFILLISPQTSIPPLKAIRPALIAAAAATAVLLVNRILRQQPLTMLSREIWLAGVLLAWTIATIPLSLWMAGSVTFLLDIFLKSLAIFWLLANAVDTRRRLRRLAWGLTLLAVPLAVTAIQNFLTGDFIPGARARRILGYDAPLTQNPNDLALMVNLLLPLAVALFLARPKPLARTVLAVVIGLDAVAVILTFSRAGFLTLVVISLAFLWKLRARRERRWLMLGLILAVACLPLLPTGYGARLATMTDTASDPTGSAQARRDDTFAALEWVARNPLVGAGLGQDTLALNEIRGPAWKAMHNVYLEFAVELGLPGLTMFLLLLAGCFGSTALVERETAGDPAKRELFYLAGGIQISLIAFSVAALFHPVGYHFYFYYIAGMAVALKAVWDRSARPAVARPDGAGARARAR